MQDGPGISYARKKESYQRQTGHVRRTQELNKISQSKMGQFENQKEK